MMKEDYADKVIKELEDNEEIALIFKHDINR